MFGIKAFLTLKQKFEDFSTDFHLCDGLRLSIYPIILRNFINVRLERGSAIIAPQAVQC